MFSLQGAERIGVISDVHANYVALEAALDYLEGQKPDALLFLGDYITDGPDPQRTLTLLRQAAARRPSFFLRGNREQYLLDHADFPEREIWRPRDGSGALLYTYDRLTAEDIAWFRSMPISHTFDEFIICHGSPARVNELVDVDGRAASSKTLDRWFSRIQKPLMICGHTHRQGMQSREVTIANGGSVGLPHDHDSRSRFMILNRKDGAWEPELISLSYDTDAILKAYHESELMEMAPAWTAANCMFLSTGHNYVLRLLKRLGLLAAERGYGTETPNNELPEELWIQAAQDLNLF